MFSRVAIVNRGEPAMRLIHAVRDLAAETGTRIETVALYTDADRAATFVRAADLGCYLGPAADRPYLDLAVLERALRDSGADAAWVGWGFVAEDPAFAELCARLGVTFVGPSPEAMRKLGDKIGAKLIAEEVGVPVAPWSRGPVEDLDTAVGVAEEIGYPLMLKATAGGGGRGIRVVTSAAQLTDAYQRTRMEAERAFGSGVVFLERLLTGARHVEVQVIADGQGTAWALGVRDCSVQRRNQKVIEESASPVLTAAQASELKAAAERLALSVGYQGAGTVEFLYQPGEQRFAFLEVNTRLQVEHPVTELTTGIDLVKTQLQVAACGKLAGQPLAEIGHAIEARLNAEDPDRDFAPSPGRIVRLDLPTGPGIRVDTGVSEGDTIPADFDSMIAKIIAYGRDRDEALARLRRALAETTVIIAGGATNKSFVLDLLEQPEVTGGTADTGWIDRVRAAGGLVSHRGAAVALAVAAIDAYEDAENLARQRLLATAHGGRPQVQLDTGRPVELKLRGAGYRVHVGRVAPHRFRVAIAAGTGPPHEADAELERFDAQTGQIVVNGQRFRLVTNVHGPTHLVEVDGVAHRISRDEGGVVRAPAPALVVATPLDAGAEVAAGAPVLVLESMKMETVLRAPFRARLRECLVTVGSLVETGAPLLRLEPLGDGDGDGDGASAGPDTADAEIDLPAEPTALPAAERVSAGLRDLRGLLLGFDTGPDNGHRLLDSYLAARAAAGPGDSAPLAGEIGLLGVFADLSDLTRNRPAGPDAQTDTQVHSPREYFHTYLQSLDAERAGLPDAFQQRLSQMLGHYGVTSLERTPELEDAVFRIFLAQRRGASDAALMTALLRQWLTEPPPGEPLRERAGLTLEHLIAATQLRFPAVADLARSVVFRWFAQPLLRRNRALVYAAIRKHLTYLDANPDAPDRADRIAAMVDSSEPLVRLLGQRIGRPGAGLAPLLEVLTRRYYGSKLVPGLHTTAVDGGTFVVAGHQDETGRSTVLATAVNFPTLPAAVRAIGEAAPDGDLVADVYLTWDGQPDDPDAMAAELHAVLAAAPPPSRLHRITTTVAGRTGAVMHHHFTFRPSADGITEERLIRGLHPMIAQRMQLERLRNFDLTRLPSADDEVRLFRCVAPANPADERFVALAQVRDLTPLRDHEGRLVALPAAENTLAACLDAIRKAQAGRRRSSGSTPTGSSSTSGRRARSTAPR